MFNFSTRYLLTLTAIVFAVVSLLVSPERLSAVGVMDQSLSSRNPLTRSTALLEVGIAKWAAGVLCLVFAALAASWPAIERSVLYQSFMRKAFFTTDIYEMLLSRFWDVALVSILGLMCASCVYIAYGNSIFSREALAFINQEDGVIESLSAAILLCAALISAMVAISLRSVSAVRAFMHGFLAVLFVIMCGEEISWGQRFLGLETPQSLSAVNVQQEINFHNMFGYLFDHLFILLFFLWGCVAPLLYATTRFFRQVVRAIGLPLPSIGLAFGMFLITVFFQDQILYWVFDKVWGLRPAEMRELFSSVAFALMMSQAYLGFVVLTGKPGAKSTR